MVGIVGLPGAGKTACLVSAYLLLAKGEFAGFDFADSSTLRAFEEIASGSRKWVKGNPPERITDRTTLANDREAGFLHLRLRRNLDGRMFDMLLPDLPGEWSKTLIDLKDAERLSFLRSSSVVWMMVDGRHFADLGRVSIARHRAIILIERLAELLQGHRPRILIVPTWHDVGTLPTVEAVKLTAAGAAHGLEIEIVPIASFSSNDAMKPGEGISDLVRRTLTTAAKPPVFWPESEPERDARALSSFRKRT